MQRLKLTAACLLLIVVAGCGGGEEEGTALKKSSSAAPVPVQAAQAPRADRPAGGNQKKAISSRQEPQKPAALTAEQMENGFTVLTEPPPNFQVLSAGPNEQADQFAVVLPEEGVSSSSFKVTPPPAAGGSGQRAASQKLPEGFEAVAGSGASESGWPLQIRCEKDDSIFMFIPGGGGPLGADAGPADASPQLTIPLKPFYMQQHEVTLKQYRVYRDDVFATKKRYRPQPLNVDSPDNHPALGLAWGEGGFYARWIGADLPTEAEWERAARTEAGWRTPWGNGRAIWSRSRELHQIDPVMSFRTDVSPYGVFDLAGNAREWVSDWYSDTAFADAAKRPLDLPNWPGPRKPSIDNHRVVKGNGPDWSVWHRAAQHMSHEAADIGFRCVLRLDAGEEEQDEKKKSTRRN
ncbi:MAG: SUMF1/EgtB/PvdO family nonheme iron enzyme [Planctomycetaceae bacterium]|nr:SUMF1/EgtB/PvdO family nonheme iron enzyme [Planctomycetaceae bacterium]